MGFIADIERQSQSIRQAILAHPFVTGVGDGTLPVEKFKHYVTQDYAYLIDYSRALALASARAPRLDDMSWFAGLLDETLNVEMALHRRYCQEFGINAQELEATVAAPSTVAYTSFLLKTAHQGSFGELVASLLPCQWGYWEIGDHLLRQGLPQNAPLYAKWIEMYTSEEFAALAHHIREMAGRIGDEAGASELAAMSQAYLTSVRLERQFWDMAYNLEGWKA
ncbi:MAG: thiaminase II [Chloroflexi bacterium]|nr:thiaminase II [Chloroflexota bacterium]MCI0810527.1 thiaminase II [Chloroflexota bacterium]MCI0863527.1 thiaminase II [Chloroflexota bacterium]MCI0900615.1 thiaminase II [Chloroflexota bacterium]